MADQQSKTLFDAACAKAATYPLSLMCTQKFPRALQNYNEKLLDARGSRLFHGKKQKLIFWDLTEEAMEFRSVSMDSDKNAVKQYLDRQTSFPRCRFVFLETSNSRGPMCCSVEQFTYLLTYHQVMPSFLDFCYEFKSSANNLSATKVRHEDYIGKHHSNPGIPHLKRSGSLIQHAFNVLGLEEPKTPDGYEWPVRHITVYHSFDITTGKSLWIIVKGNNAIQKLLCCPNGGFSKDLAADETRTPTGAFRASLRVQLQLLEWCTLYWDDYITELERNAEGLSAISTDSPIDELIVRGTPSWGSELTTECANRLRRRDTGTSQMTESKFPKVITDIARVLSSLSRATSFLTTASRRGEAGKTAQGVSDNITADSTSENQPVQPSLKDMFRYEDLQGLHKLAAKADKAVMMLKQNKRVLAEIRRKYLALRNSSGLRSSLDVEPCNADLIDFGQQILIMEGDLDNRQARLSTFSRRVEKDEALFSGILQYNGMQAAEYLMTSANSSTVQMEEWTVKMHDIAARTEQETVAMGIITFFTLVLLPCTFVATFFSSGILQFDVDDAENGRMGNWGVHRSALWLFLSLSLPLMLITLATWAIYRFAARRRERTKSTVVDLPLSEKEGDDTSQPASLAAH